MEMEEEKENTPDEVNEPETVYLKNRITHYSSYEEENEARLKYWAALSYEEHLENVNQLIKQVYKEQIRDGQNKSKTIKFRE
jgi:hypothetical protein